MNKMRICLLAVALLLIVLPWQNAAAEAVNGTLSDTVAWEYRNGTLTVSGVGRMELSTREKPPWYSLRETITRVVVEEGILDVGYDAFRDCENLTEASLPSTLTAIGYNAFRGCKSLESITIPSRVIDIGSCAFKNCESLKTVTLPNSVETLEPCAFEGCLNLESVTLSEKLAYIPGSCFRGCRALTGIVLPQSVTRIEEMAFLNCEMLAWVEIRGEITKIDEFAFQGCSSLVVLQLPASLKEIGAAAFENCKWLRKVRFAGDMPLLGDDVFLLYTTNEAVCTIYYPAENATWTKEKIEQMCSSSRNYITVEPYSVPGCSHVEVVISGEEATCTEDGLTEGGYCYVCGAVLKKQKTIAAPGHDLVTTTVPPTCTEPGYDLHRCSRCEYSETDNPVDATGHIFGEWVTVKEPTVEETGLSQRVCTACEEAEEQHIAKLTPPPTQPPTQPAATVPPQTNPAPQQTTPAPTQPNAPAPQERAEAGLWILLILAAVVGAIMAVKFLTKKKP